MSGCTPMTREEVAARLDRVDAQRILPRLGDVDLRIPPAGGVLEDMGQAAIVVERHRRDALVRQRLADVGVPHHREAIRVGIRQRPQHDPIEHREDGGGGADAERQRQHGRNGESRRAAQQPEAEADILQQSIHARG